jgi:hypothetical protein
LGMFRYVICAPRLHLQSQKPSASRRTIHVGASGLSRVDPLSLVFSASARSYDQGPDRNGTTNKHEAVAVGSLSQSTLQPAVPREPSEPVARVGRARWHRDCGGRDGRRLRWGNTAYRRLAGGVRVRNRGSWLAARLRRRRSHLDLGINRRAGRWAPLLACRANAPSRTPPEWSAPSAASRVASPSAPRPSPA